MTWPGGPAVDRERDQENEHGQANNPDATAGPRALPPLLNPEMHGPDEQADRTDRIRRRPFELWEEDGMPEGKHDQHWQQAERELNDTTAVELAQDDTE